MGERTPRQRAEAARDRLGPQRYARECAAVLAGAPAAPGMAGVLDGPGAEWASEDPDRPDRAAWIRVWAARALSWAWHPVALPELIEASGDDAWRVREMVCRIVARHRVGDAFDAVAGLRDDPVPRVRAAAERAVRVLTAAGS